MLTGIVKVIVGGQDVTSRFSPRLETVSVSRAAREASDTIQILLADPDGTTLMPDTGAPIVVEMGHVGRGSGQVFEGFVDSVRSSGGKDKGRKLSIDGTSVDNKSKVKAPGLRSKAEATFGDVAKEWGQKAGLNVTVAGSLSGEFRDFWIMQQESFMGWGQRMARELGASFKVIGGRAFFAPLNEGISASGKQLTGIRAAWGENLIDWDIAPMLGRPQYGKVKGRFYDIEKAKWEEVEQAVKDAGIDIDFRQLIGSATKDNATQSSKSVSKDSEREKGQGSVTITGDYAAEPEASVTVSGTRAGIDGTYLLDSVTHSYSKGEGFRSSLTLRLPSEGAGKDARGSASSSSSAGSTTGTRNGIETVGGGFGGSTV
ncbi:late control protein D [Devosia sp. FJ2-5-3]|uniref:phage late control D family protein n=1 Tax=Devosia sp. FJ2-5-3 TaxID=2976680 RepID=UPI0023D866BA|nr:late control protein D [Devosia sp. FJ2-5-3]WEJ60255.1 late control protein D [Devosia sp. FJ2-5-3]